MTDITANATTVSLATPTVYPRRKRKLRGSTIAIYAFLVICALFFAVPLYVIIVTSFKTMLQITEGDIFSLPREWTFEPWYKAWNTLCTGAECNGIKSGFFNSLQILVPSIVLSLAISPVTGYALALWNVKWAGTFLFILFICAFVPFQIIMIPLIILSSGIKVYGTIWGIAIVHAVLSMPFLTLVLRNYYKGIPQEIMSAAMMDAGSFWRIFREIILPMSGNILIVVLILSGLGVWEQYFAEYLTIPQMRIAVLIHSIAAVAIICVWIIHVYAAFWVQGTLRAMTRGNVSGGWAWRHHRKWLRALAAYGKREDQPDKSA